MKFFRRIRQEFINEAKVQRYLIYAVGEIFLVVIGILIALQINNWNENQKLRAEEIEALNEIKDNLITSKAILIRYMDGASSNLNSMGVVISHLANDLPYQDTLNRHLQFMWWAPHSFPRNGIETLKSRGLGLISNDSVRIEIINYYDVVESTFMANASDAEALRFQNYMMNEFIDYFSFRFEELGDKITGLVPVNYQKLINDNRAENMIRDWYNHRKYINEYRKTMLGTIEQLLEVISTEIDRIGR